MFVSETRKKEIADEFYNAVRGCIITGAYYDADSGMPVLTLSNGNGIFIQADDEGNGGGVPVAVIGKGDEQTEVGMWQV